MADGAEAAAVMGGSLGGGGGAGRRRRCAGLRRREAVCRAHGRTAAVKGAEAVRWERRR